MKCIFVIYLEYRFTVKPVILRNCHRDSPVSQTVSQEKFASIENLFHNFQNFQSAVNVIRILQKICLMLPWEWSGYFIYNISMYTIWGSKNDPSYFS